MSAAETDVEKKTRKARRAKRIEGIVANVPRLGPQTVHFDIANGCNTRCTTCWHHSPHLKQAHIPSVAWKRQRLPFESFRATLDDLLALGGLEHVILSGMGEPFTNAAVYEMVRHAHQHGIAVTIITNLLLADLSELLASDGQLDLLTSICGVSPDVWQAFHAHPRPDGWEQLVARLETLKSRGFRPKHVQVINGQNYHQLVDMVHFARRYPVKRINFKFASLLNGTEAVALTEHQKSELIHDLIPRARAFAHRFRIDTDLDAFESQVHLDSARTAPIEAVGCYMGFLYARITVTGEVLYCCNTNVPVSHLEDEPFAEAWTGSRWQGARETLRHGQYFSGCEQCGKYKQNLKWAAKLEELLPAEDWQRLVADRSRVTSVGDEP